MQTIINISKGNHFYDLSALPEKIEKDEVIDYVSSVFNDQILDAATDDFCVWTVCQDIVLGSKDPEEFRNIVLRWNEEIKELAIKTVEEWKKQGCPFGDHAHSLTNAHNALKEADDVFDVNGFHCVVGYSADFHTYLSPSEISDMLEHPDEYAVIDICYHYND